VRVRRSALIRIAVTAAGALVLASAGASSAAAALRTPASLHTKHRTAFTACVLPDGSDVSSLHC